VKKFLLIAVFVMACGLAHAEALSIGDTIKSLPGIKSGVLYNVGKHQVLAINTLEVATYGPLALNAGVLRTDGLAATLSVDLNKVKLSWLQMPILNLTNYINVGYGIGYENITFTGDYAENPKDDNHFTHGIYGAISLKF
jgi:hypothetical protein